MATDDPMPPPSPDALVGQMLGGRYRILSLLVRSRRGRVFRAEQWPAARIVALRVLDAGDPTDPDDPIRREFTRSAQARARLSHPGNVRVLDHGKTDEGILYETTELLAGRDLFETIAADAPMEAARAIRIAWHLAGALAEAQRLGLRHPELKPGHILLTHTVASRDFPRLLDLEPASPDGPSDVHALGVILFRALTGRAPGTEPIPLAAMCPAMEPAPALEAVVRRCLHQPPEEGFPSLDAVILALHTLDPTLRAPLAAGLAAPGQQTGRGLAQRARAWGALQRAVRKRGPSPHEPADRPQRARTGARAVVLAAILLLGWQLSESGGPTPAPAEPDPAADRAQFVAGLQTGACETITDPALRDDCHLAASKAPADCGRIEAEKVRGECWFQIAEKTRDPALCAKATPFVDDCALHVLSQAFPKAIPAGSRPGEHEDAAEALILSSGLAVTDMRPWSAWYRWVLGGMQPLDRAACAGVADPDRREACTHTGVALYQDLLNNARDRGLYPCDGGPLPPYLQTTPDPELDALRASRTDLCPPRP